MTGAATRQPLRFEEALETLEARLGDLERRLAPRRFRLTWRERVISGVLHPLGGEEAMMELACCLGSLPYSAEGPALRRRALALLGAARAVAGWTLKMDQYGRWSLESRTRIPRPPSYQAFIAQLAVVLLEYDLRLGELVALLHPCRGKATRAA